MISKLLINLIFFFTISSRLFSLPAIVQVKVAEDWFKVNEKYGKKDKQDFILGSLFQDRGLLEKIPTKDVNSTKIDLYHIFTTQDPFEAGGLFACYFKYKRDKVLKKWGVEQLITGIPKEKVYFFLQLLEDEIIYNPLLCGKASSYLSGISEGEILSGIQVEKLAIWHGVMYKYFSQKPSNFVLSIDKDKRMQFAFSAEQGEFWKAALLIYSNQEKIKEYLSDLLSEFDQEMEFFKMKYLKKFD